MHIQRRRNNDKLRQRIRTEYSGIIVRVLRQAHVTCICWIQKSFEVNGQQFKHLLWFVLILITIPMEGVFWDILYRKENYFCTACYASYLFLCPLKVFSEPQNKRSIKIAIFWVNRDQCFRGTFYLYLWIDFLYPEDGEMCSFFAWPEHSSSLFGELTTNKLEKYAYLSACKNLRLLNRFSWILIVGSFMKLFKCCLSQAIVMVALHEDMYAVLHTSWAWLSKYVSLKHVLNKG